MPVINRTPNGGLKRYIKVGPTFHYFLNSLSITFLNTRARSNFDKIYGMEGVIVTMHRVTTIAILYCIMHDIEKFEHANIVRVK